MNATWSTIYSTILGGAGVLAEVNLARVLLREWREGRNDACAPARAGGGHRLAGPWAVRHRMAACLVGTAALCALPLSEGVAMAQTGEPVAAEVAATAPAESKSAFTIQLNFDYTTAYFYHGIIQEDTGVIFQPAARLTANVYEKDDFKVDVFVGMWNSFHGQKTGASTQGDFTEYWYESDLLGGITLTKGKVALTMQYVFLTSPSDAYETVQELDVTLALDDSEWLEKFALHPYMTLGVETGADASDGANSNAGVYLELGVAPGFSFDCGKTPITISFPASVGLSLSDYYQDGAGDDDTFGFAQVGAKASMPLPFGERYGSWTLSAGVSALFLGDHTSDYNGGDDVEVIGTVGVQVVF